LKHLLIEAKQKVPDFLANLQSENEQYLNIGGNMLCNPTCCIHVYQLSQSVNKCPLTMLSVGRLQRLRLADDEAINWLDRMAMK